MVEVGQAAPHFTMRSSSGEKLALSDFRGRPVVLVFMPMAFSPTCQGEFRALRDDHVSYTEVGAQVLGVTVDSHWVLRAWAAQQRYPFPLLSDFHPKGAVARAYGCYDEDAGYARRATFVIDAGGVVRDVIRSEQLRTPRDPAQYLGALARL